jgi:hypothetical protein
MKLVYNLEVLHEVLTNCDPDQRLLKNLINSGASSEFTQLFLSRGTASENSLQLLSEQKIVLGLLKLLSVLLLDKQVCLFLLLVLSYC